MPRLEQVQPIPPDPEEETAVEKEAEQAVEPEPELEPAEEPRKQEEEAVARKKKKLKAKPARPFPAPAVRYYHDDHQSPKGQPSEFFKYWKRLCSDPEFRQRVVVYIYRAWPAMLDGKRQVAKIYDDALTPEDLLRQYGCGDYVLRLNDTGSNGLNITNCQIRNLGARQLNEFPPVLNLEDLDFDDKSNQSYLLWARSRGMLTPEQEKKIRSSSEQKKEEGDDMANAEAIKQLASTVDRITDKVITVASKEKEDGGGGRLPEKLLDLVTAASASATQSAAQIMQESVKQVLELQRQNANPLQNLKEVANTLKELIPRNDSANEVVSKLIDQDKRYTETIFQIQHQRIESLEKMLEKFLSAQLSQPQPGAPAAPAAVPAPVQKSPLEMLKEMAAMKDELREILGIEDREEPGWMKYAPLITQAVSVLGVYLANAMHNLAVARTGQGKPEPPPQPQQPAPAAAQAPVQETAPPQQSQEDAMKQFHQFLQRIERPLLRSFNDGESGADFAARLIELTDDGLFGPQVSGRQIYDAVLEYGQDVVATLIKTYPPIWSVVSQTPQKWEKFLSEFFRADEIWAKEEQQGA